VHRPSASSESEGWRIYRRSSLIHPAFRLERGRKGPRRGGLRGGAIAGIGASGRHLGKEEVT